MIYLQDEVLVQADDHCSHVLDWLLWCMFSRHGGTLKQFQECGKAWAGI